MLWKRSDERTLSLISIFSLVCTLMVSPYFAILVRRFGLRQYLRTDSADSVPSSRLYQARRSALAALGQIKASIQPAHEQLAESAMLSYDIIAIYTLAKSGVFDILASDDVEKSIGLHVTEIYERMDDDKKFNVSILT